MKANDYALNLSRMNFEAQFISQREHDILSYIKNMIYNLIPNANFYATGSYRAKTSVIGQSDIDLLLVLPYPVEGIGIDKVWAYLMSLSGYLRDKVKLNLDGYFDPPAYVIEDLEFHNTTKIEITAALTAKVIGGNESDFLIPNRFCNALIITNPERRFKVVEYLNKITDNYFSYVTILIKIINKRLKLNLPSFAVESFLYFWFRGRYNTDLKMNVSKESNRLDFTYDPYKYMGILDLYYMTFSALFSMAKEFDYYCRDGRILKMENPYIEGFDEYVQFCETIEEQEVMSNMLFSFTDFMYSFVHREEVTGREMDFVFFGEDITEPPYKKNDRSYYALREQYLPVLKNIRQALFDSCKDFLDKECLSPHHFLYFEIIMCLKDRADLLRYMLSTAQGIEYSAAFKEIYQNFVDAVKLCSSVSIREKMLGVNNPEKFGDFALELIRLFPRFLTEDSFENTRRDIIDSCSLCQDCPPPFLLKWEQHDTEFSSCMFRSLEVYKEYLRRGDWKCRIVNVILAQT